MGSSKAATPAGRRKRATRPASARPGRKPPPAAKPASRSRAPAKGATRQKRPASGRLSKPRIRRPRPKAGSARPRKPRRSGAPASRRVSGWPARIAILALVAICAAGGYWFWLRDSSLVAVSDVEVVGVRSGERELIVAELTEAAKDMSTLHVDQAELTRIGARFSTVASLSVDPNFPHGLRIEVVERPPALRATSGEEQAAVAADGSVLSGVEAPEGLPRLQVEQLPATGKLEGADLEQALVAGAAPAPLAPLIEGVSKTKEDGVVVTLRGGIPVRFGDPSRVAEKWAAAAAVLADPKLSGLGYLDVRVPKRPAVAGA
jgi:cell division protein FtsQ